MIFLHFIQRLRLVLLFSFGFWVNSQAADTDLTVSLELVQKPPRLYAELTVKQPVDELGSIWVNFVSPDKANCIDSEYELMYKGLSFRTRAYRTIMYSVENGSSFICKGLWEVKVVDQKGNQLARKTLLIDDRFPEQISKSSDKVA